ncbi:MAG: glutathione peroxidase [Burkholderiaceae bacterium]
MPPSLAPSPTLHPELSLADRTGQSVPHARFHSIENGQSKSFTSDELFKGRRVIVFSLPGAYTPTCSTTHLPRFEELTPTFRQMGIDDVICLSVNDPFVMDEWRRTMDVKNVQLVPDGNGEFSDAMGMLVDKRDLGLGCRSWRYSMLVDDGRIERMFIEPPEEGDPFHVSDADTMLRHLDPHAKAPPQIALLSRKGCQWCQKARDLLTEAGLSFVDVDLPGSSRSRALGAIAGASTVPQVFIDGERIGGTPELEAYLAQRGAAR